MQIGAHLVLNVVVLYMATGAKGVQLIGCCEDDDGWCEFISLRKRGTFGADKEDRYLGDGQGTGQIHFPGDYLMTDVY